MHKIPIFNGHITMTDRLDMADIFSDDVFIAARNEAEEMVIDGLEHYGYDRESISTKGIAGIILDGQRDSKILHFVYFELDAAGQFELQKGWFWLRNE